MSSFLGRPAPYSRARASGGTGTPSCSPGRPGARSSWESCYGGLLGDTTAMPRSPGLPPPLNHPSPAPSAVLALTVHSRTAVLRPPSLASSSEQPAAPAPRPPPHSRPPRFRLSWSSRDLCRGQTRLCPSRLRSFPWLPGALRMKAGRVSWASAAPTELHGFLPPLSLSLGPGLASLRPLPPAVPGPALLSPPASAPRVPSAVFPGPQLGPRLLCCAWTVLSASPPPALPSRQ